MDTPLHTKFYSKLVNLILNLLHSQPVQKVWRVLWLAAPWTERTDFVHPHVLLETGFEGYYCRTQLYNGGTLAVIFCWVNTPSSDPQSLRNLVHVSYTPPPDGASAATFPAFTHEFFPPGQFMINKTLNHGRDTSFVVHTRLGTAEDLALLEVDVEKRDAQITIRVRELGMTVIVRLHNQEPWSHYDTREGPMGALAALSPLFPVSWHVWSTGSEATCSITHKGPHGGTLRFLGTGLAHLEKNWGSSFPRGWVWAQAVSFGLEERRLCFAGGAALPLLPFGLMHVEAYLLGYRSRELHWDFRPPYTMALGLISPFMRVDKNSEAGKLGLVVQTLCRKLVVRVEAPPGSFIGMAAPLSEGYRPMYAFESFRGRTWVEAWTRRWPWQSWTLVEEGECGVNERGVPCSALEFGGMYSHLVPKFH